MEEMIKQKLLPPYIDTWIFICCTCNFSKCWIRCCIKVFICFSSSPTLSWHWGFSYWVFVFVCRSTTRCSCLSVSCSLWSNAETEFTFASKSFWTYGKQTNKKHRTAQEVQAWREQNTLPIITDGFASKKTQKNTSWPLCLVA